MLQEPVLLSVVFTIYKGSWDTSKHFIALFRVLNNSQNIIIHVLILTISYNKLCSLVVSNQSNAIYELVHRELILDWRCSIWQATVQTFHSPLYQLLPSPSILVHLWRCTWILTWSSGNECQPAASGPAAMLVSHPGNKPNPIYLVSYRLK